MKNTNIKMHSASFFEGWYLKHETEDFTICFIPGINFDAKGNPTAFIQVITDNGSHIFDFAYEEFFADKRNFFVKIGNNIFSKNGIEVDLHSQDFCCKGSLTYGKFLKPNYDIMGFFKHFPFMECKHGVLSCHHTVSGSLKIDGQRVDFFDANGYIEKDWGSSFPSSYIWIHGRKHLHIDLTLMVAIAKIPYLGMSFDGLIALMIFNGKQYRFATYNGGKVVENSPNRIVLKRQRYKLVINLPKHHGKPLKAPIKGEMHRIIHENPSCEIHVGFFKGKKEIFSTNIERASYESALE